MTPKRPTKDRAAKLRQAAEKRLAKRVESAPPQFDKDTGRLVHELQVHQVELEIQNEELRQAKAELEAAYKELYDFAPVGYFTLGRYGVIEKINLTGASMLGQPRYRLLGQRFASFVTTESLPAFDIFLHQVMAGHERESCTVTLMKGGNTPIVAYVEATRVDEESSFRAVVVSITSAEQAKLALHESEERLKMALAASHMGVWECECDTWHIYWSQECAKIFGVDALSPKLDTLAQLLHPEDAPRVRSIVRQALADAKERLVECRIVRNNGQVVWVSVVGQVQCDKGGKPLRLVGIAQDITERKLAEEEKARAPKRRVKSPPDTQDRNRARAVSKAGGRGKA